MNYQNISSFLLPLLKHMTYDNNLVRNFEMTYNKSTFYYFKYFLRDIIFMSISYWGILLRFDLIHPEYLSSTIGQLVYTIIISIFQYPLIIYLSLYFAYNTVLNNEQPSIIRTAASIKKTDKKIGKLYAQYKKSVRNLLFYNGLFQIITIFALTILAFILRRFEIVFELEEFMYFIIIYLMLLYSLYAISFKMNKLMMYDYSVESCTSRLSLNSLQGLLIRQINNELFYFDIDNDKITFFDSKSQTYITLKRQINSFEFTQYTLISQTIDEYISFLEVEKKISNEKEILQEIQTFRKIKVEYDNLISTKGKRG